MHTNRSSNLWVGGGELVVQALREEPPSLRGAPYTSARIRTTGKYSVQPSQRFPTIRIETRLKAPVGLGLWPSLW